MPLCLRLLGTRTALNDMTMLSAAASLAVGALLMSSISGSIVNAADGYKLGGRQIMQTLMHKARPYKSSSSRRRVEEDNENNFDGSYNLQFGQCVDVKLLDNDLFSDDVIEYTKAGSIISTKSYVLFHVCQQGACDSASEDDLYLLDLSSYVQYVASYHASVKGDYCTACDTYYNDFCGAYQAASNDDASAEADYYDTDDAGRKLLEQHSRRTTSYITCSQCESYGCTGNSDDVADDNEDDVVTELITQLSSCLNAGVSWNNNNLYVGFMCSPYDGDGVEIAVFLDEKCTVYTNQKSFADIPSYYIYNSADTFTMAETYIKYAFTKTMSCTNEEFDDPANEGSGNNDDAAAEDKEDVNGYCSNMFDTDMVAFNSCSKNVYQSGTYSFYDYDMNYNSLEYLDSVCSAIQQKRGAYTYYYDVENSGSWNNHQSRYGKDSVGNWHFLHEEISFWGSWMAVCLYITIAIASIVLVVFVVRASERRRRKNESEPVFEGTDSISDFGYRLT